jgi:hypothetical protein
MMKSFVKVDCVVSGHRSELCFFFDHYYTISIKTSSYPRPV